MSNAPIESMLTITYCEFNNVSISCDTIDTNKELILTFKL